MGEKWLKEHILMEKHFHGVNVNYASDKNWANSVYKYISYLYNKL